jgi:peptidoglycan hydrolase-like protein with peptidoglycan-binding domain
MYSVVLMRNALLVFLGLWMATPLWADDLTRALQQRLKDQGFYYGEVNGQGGDETTSAVRRYQIRHGLKVTGQPNDETLHALGLTSSSSSRPVPGYQDDQVPPIGKPNQRDYRSFPDQYDEQQIPQSEAPEDYNQMRPPPVLAPGSVTSLPRLFAGTLYQGSPPQVQENVLYAVQGELMRRGLFRGAIDGQLGPATLEAIVRLQQYEGLRVSGRLDNPTLDDLQAFPGQRNGPPPEGTR